MPESCCVPIRKDASLEVAALVGCAVMTGFGAAVLRARVEPGSTAVVYGAGGVGLSAILGVQARRAPARSSRRTRSRSSARPRSSSARRTPSIRRSEDVPALLRELTDGRGADYAFDTAGAPGVVAQAYDAVRRGGMVVSVGIPAVGRDGRPARGRSSRARRRSSPAASTAPAARTWTCRSCSTSTWRAGSTWTPSSRGRTARRDQRGLRGDERRRGRARGDRLLTFAERTLIGEGFAGERRRTRRTSTRCSAARAGRSRRRGRRRSRPRAGSCPVRRRPAAEHGREAGRRCSSTRPTSAATGTRRSPGEPPRPASRRACSRPSPPASFPPGEVDALVLIAAVWVDWAAEDEEAIYADNVQATRDALAAGAEGRPAIEELLALRTEPAEPVLPPLVKITGVRLERLRLPLDPPFEPPGIPEPRHAFEATLVFVETDEGLTGIGSGDTMDGFERYVDLFVGEDPLDDRAPRRACWRRSRSTQAATGRSRRRSGTWPARRQGVPGGAAPRRARSDRLAVYASTGDGPLAGGAGRVGTRACGSRASARSRCGSTASAIERRPRRRRGRAGRRRDRRWRSWSTSIRAGACRGTSRPLLRTRRSTTWPRRLGRPTSSGSRSRSPADDVAGLARLRAESGLRIAGGEMARTTRRARRLPRAGEALDVYQPDAVLAVGLLRARELAGRVLARGRWFTPHTWTNGIGLLANLHLAAGVGGGPFLEFPYDPPGWTPERRDFMLAEPVRPTPTAASRYPTGPASASSWTRIAVEPLRGAD